MGWQPLAVIVPLTFVLYQAIAKTLPKGISVFLVNGYAFLIGMLAMFLLHFITASDKSITLDKKYFMSVIGIGLLLSAGNFGIIKAFSLGAPQALFSAIFYTVLIIYGVLFGLIIWREQLHVMQILGIVLALSGLFITAYFRK